MLGPIKRIEVVDEAVGIVGNFEHPLWHLTLLDNVTRSFTSTVSKHLLVGNHSIAPGAPVDRTLAAVGDTLLEKLSKHELRPAVVVGVGTACGLIPGKGITHTLELATHESDVVIRPYFRVKATLYSSVFSRETKGVKAHRVDDLPAGHAAIAHVNVGYRKGVPVTNVEVP